MLGLFCFSITIFEICLYKVHPTKKDSPLLGSLHTIPPVLQLSFFYIWRIFDPHGRGEDAVSHGLRLCNLETPPRAWGRPAGNKPCPIGALAQNLLGGIVALDIIPVTVVPEFCASDHSRPP